jgi:hypothetical protein
MEVATEIAAAAAVNGSVSKTVRQFGYVYSFSLGNSGDHLPKSPGSVRAVALNGIKYRVGHDRGERLHAGAWD